MRAPSSLNTQPWHFYVVTGEPLDRIREGNTERNLAGVPHSREFTQPRRLPGRAPRAADGDRKTALRRHGHRAGTTRNDAQDWVLRGFRQFDAPVSVVVTYDRSIHGGDIATIRLRRRH